MKKYEFKKKYLKGNNTKDIKKNNIIYLLHIYYIIC